MTAALTFWISASGWAVAAWLLRKNLRLKRLANALRLNGSVDQHLADVLLDRKVDRLRDELSDANAEISRLNAKLAPFQRTRDSKGRIVGKAEG